MEMLILSMIIAATLKNSVVDTVAMATGKTPPSHAYRMAKLKERAATERRRVEFDPDTRGGVRMLLRHWYLDACEDVDHWRANRHRTKPQRKAAARRRRREREQRIRDWAARHVPTDEPPGGHEHGGRGRKHQAQDENEDGQDIVDAEIVDEGFTPPPAGGDRPEESPFGDTDTTTVEDEPSGPAGTEVAVVHPDEETLKAPLPHRRMVLMTMLATAGYAPDTDAIAHMTSEEVDGAIAALVAHERATRTTAHH